MVAAALGIGWFIANGGARALRLDDLGWILRDGTDTSQHWLGWAFFRRAPWQLPLGAAPAYAVPLGGSLAFLDSIPLVGLLLRPLAHFLPVNFQYLGPWVAACFALQGWFGARLTGLFTRSFGSAVAGGSLFVASPVLLRRLGHEALCAHFLILAVLCMALAPTYDAHGAKKASRAALAVSVVAATIHPTLAAMALALSVALLIRLRLHDRAVTTTAALGGFAAMVTLAMGVFALLGYLSGPPLSSRGFGYFSSDLLTLLNPMGWSRTLPSFPTRPGQYEGFGYLGLGTLALLVTGCVVRLRSHHPVPWRRILPVLLVSLLLAAFAVSTYVTLAGKKRFGTTDPFGSLAFLVAPFRASGRFIWPLHYLVLAAAVAMTCQTFRSRPVVRFVLLAGAVSLQIADLGFDRQSAYFQGGFTPLPSVLAEEGNIAHVAMFPPRLVDADGRGCHPEPRAGDVRGGYLAYTIGATFNSGYLSRIDLEEATAACALEEAAVTRGDLAVDTLYLVVPAWLRAIPTEAAICGRFGEAIACVARGRSSPLAAALEAARVR